MLPAIWLADRAVPDWRAATFNEGTDAWATTFGDTIYLQGTIGPLMVKVFDRELARPDSKT